MAEWMHQEPLVLGYSEKFLYICAQGHTFFKTMGYINSCPVCMTKKIEPLIFPRGVSRLTPFHHLRAKARIV